MAHSKAELRRRIQALEAEVALLKARVEATERGGSPCPFPHFVTTPCPGPHYPVQPLWPTWAPTLIYGNTSQTGYSGHYQ